jgi:sugar diacid utilization regulator
VDQQLSAVAAAAAVEAGGHDPGLLGGYLDQLAAAADSGTRLDDAALADARAAGGRAADEDVPLRALVDLFLSATWRAWRVLPAVSSAADLSAVHAVGEAVLRAADDAVAAAADGYQAARRWVIRREEATRREFVDDLLSGTADTASLLARAEQFGLDLAATHTVVVAIGPAPFRDATPVLAAVEDAAVQATAGLAALTTSKDGQLVCVLPSAGAAADDVAVTAVSAAVDRALSASGAGESDAGDDETSWRCGIGRAYRGAAGIRRSYDEARDSIALADRLRLRSPVVRARDLLVYWVLLRDREAITDLVETVLTPLRRARGGAEPLLSTLTAYLAHGGNTTAAARAVHLSVRAVTYRLARIHELTGHDPREPQQRYALQTALIGAQMLDGAFGQAPAG